MTDRTPYAPGSDEAVEAARDLVRKAKLEQKQHRDDVQAVMALPEMRRMLWKFLRQAGVDHSPFSENEAVMRQSVGWADAGRWWLQEMRDHCHEREAQMRNEARRPIQSTEGDTHDD